MKREWVEFGESVYFQPLDALKSGGFNDRYIDGVWLGIRPQTSEVIVGNKDGIFKARSVRRRPECDRWNSEAILDIKGTPWRPYGFTDSDKLRIKLPNEPNDDSDKQPPMTRSEERYPRKFKIERRDIEQYGPTPHCPGCYSALNQTSRNHILKSAD